MRQTSNGLIGVIGRFLFAPTDPTPLGFMRIMTGILVLYTTFAYSFDLKWMMGPDAFSNQDFENQARRERSYVSFPVSWDYLEPSIRLEDSPHRREALIEFMRGLPESVGERKQKLAFLVRLVGLPYEEQQACLFLPNSAARLATDAEFAQVAKALEATDPKKADSPVTFPAFVWKMPVEQRLEFWSEIRAFTDLLPTDPSQQEFVLSWLSYYPFDYRQDLVRFLAGDFRHPSGKQLGLPEDPEVRAELLRYLNEWGLDPRQHDMKSTPTYSAYFHLKNIVSMWCFHLLVMGLAILFTVGLFTRVTGVLLYLTSLSYIHRSTQHMFGQDTMQTILLLYLMIGPSGATFSLDALLRRYRASRALQAAGGKPVPWAEDAMNGPQPSWMANFVLRLFQMHYGVIYLVSGASKLKGNAWWNHTSGWLTMVNPDFGLVHYPIFENSMHWLADQRLLVLLVSGFAVFFTIGLEISFIFLVWTRAPAVMVMWAMIFHTSIAVFMGLCVFAMYMFTLLLCYFPAKLLRERVGVSPGSGGRLTVRFDGNSARQMRTVAVLKALDLGGQITFVEEANLKALALTNPSGRKRSGHGVLGRSLSYLTLTKSFGWIFQFMASPNEAAGNDSPASLTTASVLFFGGIALFLGGAVGLTLGYVANDGVRPGIPLMLLCVSGMLTGIGSKMAGLRSMLFKGAL